MKYSNETNKLLLTMLNKNGINRNRFSPDILHHLFTDGIICNSSDYHNNNVYLTYKGKAYIEQLKIERARYNEEKRRSWIQFWIPFAVSLFALLRPEITILIKWFISILS